MYYNTLTLKRKESSHSTGLFLCCKLKGFPAVTYFPHPVAGAVSSALGHFTSVFGMGTGGSTPLEPPESLFKYIISLLIMQHVSFFTTAQKCCSGGNPRPHWRKTHLKPKCSRGV